MTLKAVVGWLAPDGRIKVVQDGREPMTPDQSWKLVDELSKAHPDQVYMELWITAPKRGGELINLEDVWWLRHSR